MYRKYRREKLEKQSDKNGHDKDCKSGLGVAKESLTDKVLSGWIIHAKGIVSAKTVRIFTSSTFTDTGFERNALMKDVYPRLKEYCQERGYDFQVVDMRWGIRDASANDHMTTELCMEELRLCQQLSTGPNFVTFLSQKYGYQPFPRVVEKTEFEDLYSAMSQHQQQLMDKWFCLDTNIIPASYVLQPISTHYPEYLEKINKEVYQRAKQLWNEDNTIMQDALISSARSKFSADVAKIHKYVMSVTEDEITNGILDAKDTKLHAAWFKRNIVDLAAQKKTPKIGRYSDSRGSAESNVEAHRLLTDLKENKLGKALPKSNIFEYDIHWCSKEDKGMDPINIKEHSDYLRHFCSDFERQLLGMISSGIERNQLHGQHSDTYEEVVLHSAFALRRCKTFFGREDSLEVIKSYVQNKSRKAFIVHGASGCGKTTIMAAVAQKAQEWYRFIGTTPKSSSLRALLVSVFQQILHAYQIPLPGDKAGLDVEELQLPDLISLFPALLKIAASRSRPLLVLLDSLDQFLPDGMARQLHWLPIELPRHVKLVLSTLEDVEYECFPRLQHLMADSPDQFHPVPTVSALDVKGIIQKLLTTERKQLTEKQFQLLLDAFRICPIPLYLKLCFGKALLWASYTPEHEMKLPMTSSNPVRDIINELFDRLEVKHGQKLVAKVLGLITISRNGLSDNELDDLLSCEEEVLDDVYQFWTPPVRRLPPMLLIRLKADLKTNLVDRGADGIKVTYWYHRQFIEAAEERYCHTAEDRKEMHRAIAHLFLGTWAQEPKPYKDKKTGLELVSLRQVPSQPLKHGNVYNMRKLMEMPVHLIKGDMLRELKEHVLLNISWIIIKLQATSFNEVMEDYSMAQKQFPNDEELPVMIDILRLSETALKYDPKQLPGQILGRSDKGLASVMSQCRSVSHPCLIPDAAWQIQPGGDLIYALSEHKADITSLDISQDGRTALTAGDDYLLIVWDCEAGKPVRILEGLFKQSLEKVRFCNKDEHVAMGTEKELCIYRTGSWDVCHRIKGKQFHDCPFTPCGQDRQYVLCGGSDNKLYLLNVATGTEECSIEDPLQAHIEEEQLYSLYDVFEGCKDYAATVSCIHEEDRYLRIIDVKNKTFLHRVKVYEAANPDGDDIDYDTIAAVAFTFSESSIVLTGSQNSDFIVIDVLSGNKLRNIKGVRNGYTDKLHSFPGAGSMVVCQTKSDVSIISADTGKIMSCFRHTSRIQDVVVSPDVSRLVTIASDNTVRVWTMNNLDLESLWTTKVTKYRPAKKEKVMDTYSCHTLELLPDCCHLLVKRENKYKKKNEKYELCVYNIHNRQYVRCAVLSESVLYIDMISCTKILVKINRKLKVIDIDDMSCVLTFVGKMPKYSAEAIVVKDGAEVVAITKALNGLKVYSAVSGSVIALMKHPTLGHKKEIENLLVTKDGCHAVTCCDEGPFDIWDIKQKSIVRQIKSTWKGVELFMSDAILSPCGCYLLSTVYRGHKGLNEDMVYPAAWDIHTGKVVSEMFDFEAQQKYEMISKDNPNALDPSQSCQTLVRVNDCYKAVVGCDDGDVRIFDLTTGRLEQCLTGHQSSVSCFPVNVTPYVGAEHRYLTSCVKSGGENSVRMWNIRSEPAQEVAAFTFDYEANKIVQVSHGESILCFNKSTGDFRRLDLQPNDGTKTQKEISLITAFEGKILDGFIELSSPNDLVDDVGDPDDDASIATDDEDDDEDDNNDDENSFDKKERKFYEKVDGDGKNQEAALDSDDFDLDVSDLDDLDDLNLDELDSDELDDTNEDDK